MNATEFATIEKYPGYGFGSDGSVWSCWSRNGFVTDEWRQLSAESIKGGYLRVRLRTKPNTYVHRQVAHLILEAFVSLRPEGMVACHYDGDVNNNAVSNLRWDTRRRNEEDKKRHGTHQTGEGNPAAKLTEKDVREIRKIRKEMGFSTYKLASIFGVSRPVICKIIRRELWRCVE